MQHQRQKHFIARQDGFTLIEVLIVIVIFSIGILGAMSMQTKAVTTNATTLKSTLALEYATDTMERLLRVNPSNQDRFNVDDDGVNGIDDANEATDLNSDGLDNDGDGIVDNETVWHRLPEFQAGNGYTRGAFYVPADPYYAGIFNLTWNITDINCDGNPNPGNDAKRIDITVTWNNGNESMQLSNIRTSVL